MTSVSSTPFFLPACVAAAAGLWLVRYIWASVIWRRRSSGRPLPPGPKPLPIIGNLLDLPSKKPWQHLSEMTAQYGNMINFRVANCHILTLNSEALVTEFLGTRSANTAHRPQRVSLTSELIGHQGSLAFLPYGDEVRSQRRMLGLHIGPGVVATTSHSALDLSVRRLLVSLLDHPRDLRGLTYHSVVMAILKMIYGIDAPEKTDQYAVMSMRASETFGEAVSGQLLAVLLPVLRYIPAWIPGAVIQARFDKCKKVTEEFKKAAFEKAKEVLAHDDACSSMAAKLLANEKARLARANSHENEEVYKIVCLLASVAAYDSVFSGVQGMLLALAMYPDVRIRAQEELDAVVGPNRLPDFSDRDKLVYINAFIKEALRWHVIGPVGAPHETIEDDEFHGYFIPAGTIVLSNIWNILHDPELYDDPFEFRPERFLGDEPARDPTRFIFGFGRRTCPGRHFAMDAMYIFLVSVLHVFDVVPLPDEKGDPVKLEMRQSDSIVSQPEDCRFMVKPRSADAVALIQELKSK
ncbi:CyP450 monooxygenase [Trametes elegans]|nr:CyP450 monooxygenase [Trametes elegans]